MANKNPPSVRVPPSSGPWKRVVDELPDAETQVLVCNPSTEVFGIAYYDGVGWRSADSDWTLSMAITHWMDLPEFPSPEPV